MLKISRSNRVRMVTFESAPNILGKEKEDAMLCTKRGKMQTVYSGFVIKPAPSNRPTLADQSVHPTHGDASNITCFIASYSSCHPTTKRPPTACPPVPYYPEERNDPFIHFSNPTHSRGSYLPNSATIDKNRTQQQASRKTQ
ncbi:hypothetical protein GGR58DRAFT_313698 [Xylaria digitata]|nr:hypothetical protein GGR58DRAFT_313698 [Xylaria digitata]